MRMEQHEPPIRPEGRPQQDIIPPARRWHPPTVHQLHPPLTNQGQPVSRGRLHSFCATVQLLNRPPGTNPPGSSRTAPALQTGGWCRAGRRSSCRQSNGGELGKGGRQLGNEPKKQQQQAAVCRVNCGKHTHTCCQPVTTQQTQRCRSCTWATRAHWPRWAGPADCRSDGATRPGLESAAASGIDTCKGIQRNGKEHGEAQRSGCMKSGHW